MFKNFKLLLTMISTLKNVALVIGGCNTVGYALSAVFETHKLTDLTGAGSFVLATFFLSDMNGLFSSHNHPHANRLVLVNLAVIMWGIRLALYLFIRVMQLGEDKRLRKFYRQPDEQWFDARRSYYPVNLALFWFLQALWGIVGMLPVTFMNASSLNIELNLKTSSIGQNVLTLLPFIVLFGGIVIESIADTQKTEYRKNPDNNNHWCDKGLYSLARYPNYFGEIVVWWGIYFACLPSLTRPYALVSLLSPLFTTFLLLKVSGIPLLEKKYKKEYGNNPEYLKYVRKTNLLVPLPRIFGKPKEV